MQVEKKGFNNCIINLDNSWARISYLGWLAADLNSWLRAKNTTAKEEDGGSQEAESKADEVEIREVSSEVKKVESDVTESAKEAECEAKIWMQNWWGG